VTSFACTWATGVLAYYLLTNQYPFDGPSGTLYTPTPETRREDFNSEQLDLILHSIVHDEADIDVPALRPFSPACKSFLVACLKVRQGSSPLRASEKSVSYHCRSLHLAVRAVPIRSTACLVYERVQLHDAAKSA